MADNNSYSRFESPSTSFEIPTSNSSITREKNPFKNGKLNAYYIILTPVALTWFLIEIIDGVGKRKEYLDNSHGSQSENRGKIEGDIDGRETKPTSVTFVMVFKFLGYGTSLLFTIWNLYFTPQTLEMVHNKPKRFISTLVELH